MTDPFDIIVQQLALFSSGATFTFVPSEALLALPYLQHLRNWDEPSKSASFNEQQGRKVYAISAREVGRLQAYVPDEEMEAAVKEVFEAMKTNEKAHNIFREVGLRHNIREHVLRTAVAKHQ